MRFEAMQRLFPTETGRRLSLQKSIESALEKSRTPREFFFNASKIKGMPNKERIALKKAVKEIGAKQEILKKEILKQEAANKASVEKALEEKAKKATEERLKKQTLSKEQWQKAKDAAQKQKLSEQAEKAKQAMEVPVGGSEAEATQAVKNVFTKNKSQEAQIKKMSKEDIAELERLDREEAETLFAKGGTELLGGTVAGVEQDEQGNITLDPAKFLMGVLGVSSVKGLSKVYKSSPKTKAKVEKALKSLASDSTRVAGDMLEKINKQIGLDIEPKIIADVKATQPLKKHEQLKVIHNLSSENLDFVDKYFKGEIPAPSIAVTGRDIPFESFGNITMVGSKEVIDPKIAANKTFGADAYTKRTPRAEFKKDIEKYRDLRTLTSFYDKGYRIEGFMEEVLSGSKTTSQAANDVKYSDDMKKIYKGQTGKRYSEKAAKEWWIDQFESIKSDATFNISDDYYNKKMRDYTPDNIVKYIKKSSVTNSEGFNYGLGSTRAQGLRELKSIKAIKEQTAPLITSVEMDKFKTNLQNRMIDIEAELQPFSNYSTVDSEALNEIIAGFMQGYTSRALTKDFTDVPEDLVKKIAQFGAELATAPTEYYESKLLRGVDLSEFTGAIVPKGTPKRITDILKKKGVKVKLYDPKDSEAREKILQDFLENNPNTLFMNPLTSLISVGAAVGAENALSQKDKNKL